MSHTRLADLVNYIDLVRLDATRRIAPAQRAAFGQFLTPAPIARHMAGLISVQEPQIRILDAGAGVGTLFSAAVAELCARPAPPQAISVTAYEVDPLLANYLPQALEQCRQLCQRVGITFTGDVITDDFIVHGSETIRNPLFHDRIAPYNVAILNPPYRKIRSDSAHRNLLRQFGMETSNLYTGFLALALSLLVPNGELIAITPRSFCNGPYFRAFRQAFLAQMALHSIHLFEARDQAFQDDAVLQENIIFAAIKTDCQPEYVTIQHQDTPEDEWARVQQVPYTHIVHPEDREQFIRLPVGDQAEHVAVQMHALSATLDTLGLSVSTGRVVDFRAAAALRHQPESNTVPLLYPTHLEHGRIVWPKLGGKKPNALLLHPTTADLLIPNERYVLIRRFSAKEERRRVVAVVCDLLHLPSPYLGIENHLNYIHCRGRGLDQALARGLAAYLNSTLVDLYVRQFSGHTQVNATDLRSLRYPSLIQLRSIGKQIADRQLTQAELDALISKEIATVEEAAEDHIQQRIHEALSILQALGFPRAQLNERSALTLLALLDLTPHATWADAQAPLCGITPMMTFFAQHYGKYYKPNTRETVRRQSVHQFLEAGLITINPDQPDRPINSPKSVYQITTDALALMRTFDTPTWEAARDQYMRHMGSLQERYAQERARHRIPIQLPSGVALQLSPGGKNVLIKHVIDEFAPRFTPGGTVVYVGDAEAKFAFVDETQMQALGLQLAAHGKMPDIIIFYTAKQWLILIEAVTSHGPIDPKRRDELLRLFEHAHAGIVFVTAFLTRQAMKEYLPQISWATEVWVADAPDHLIHFDGDRFLGPYST
jgi:adenine-specific DNA-methyltransferase